jgi:hypothetical protein
MMMIEDIKAKKVEEGDINKTDKEQNKDKVVRVLCVL